MIVVDTNILVYASGRDHPLRERCFVLLESVAEGRTEGTTTVDVIQEFMHVRSRSHDRENAAQVASDYASLLSPLIVVGEPELRAGMRLFERHAALDAFDAVLAATAIANDAQALVSADTEFGSIPRLRYVDPAGPALDELIGR